MTSFVLYSCQQNDEFSSLGYLKINIGTNEYVDVNSRISEEYNPKQISVKIINEEGSVVKSFDDASSITENIALAPGKYTVNASSFGFDGSESGFEIPYYAGFSEVVVEKNKAVTANVECTLANVKVTVNYDDSFVKVFQSATSVVSSAKSNVGSLTFKMGSELKEAYFPVADLNVKVSVVNKEGKEFSQDTPINNVKARKHYIINFKVKDTGSVGGVNVSVDGTETIYTFTFNVSTTPTTQVLLDNANAWSSFAYLSGQITTKEDGEINSENVMFEYKLKSQSEWISVPSTAAEENVFKATLRGLQANSEYDYRMTYKDKEESFNSEELTFRTEDQPTIPNMSFDEWCSVTTGSFIPKTTYYAASDESTKFWDSGNEGANTLKETNPTSPEENDVVKGKAAKLTSTTAAGQFAAGSLFTGDFRSASINPLGAKLDFGRPFTGRPTQLRGYYKYNPGNIDYIKTDKVSAVLKGDRDICSIYILLADWNEPFAVSTGDNKFIDINDGSIIAYGELSNELNSPASMSEYKEFIIDLKYRDLKRKPTYVLIVCSSSKYGDYFTGSTSSVLLIDEFELIYGEPILE